MLPISPVTDEMLMTRPRATLEHVHERRLGHVEAARQVHAQHLVPVVDGHLPDRPVDGDAGIVDQDVQATVLVDHLVHDTLAVVKVAHVALMQRQLPSVGLDGLAQLVGPSAVR
jgi:hypothetical protein